VTDTLVPPPVDEADRAPAAEPSLEQYRRRLRRRLFLWSAPVVLVVLLVALKLLSLPLFAALTQHAYDDRAFERAASLSEPLGVANLVEPWVHHFDRGTAYARVGVLDVARAEFVTALDLAPEGDETISCVVRTDLVLVIEAQGDAALLELRYADAEQLYELGRTTVDEAPEGCFQPPDDPQQPDTSQPLDDARERLDEKEQQAQGGDQGDPSGGDGSEPGQGGGEDEGEGGAGGQDPLDQLRQQGDDSQQERQQDTDRERYYEQAPGEYDGRPW